MSWSPTGPIPALQAGRGYGADVVTPPPAAQLMKVVFRAVIDRTYPMSEVVEARRYVEAWHKAGNVVLTIP